MRSIDLPFSKLADGVFIQFFFKGNVAIKLEEKEVGEEEEREKKKKKRKHNSNNSSP